MLWHTLGCGVASAGSVNICFSAYVWITFPSIQHALLICRTFKCHPLAPFGIAASSSLHLDRSIRLPRPFTLAAVQRPVRLHNEPLCKTSPENVAWRSAHSFPANEIGIAAFTTKGLHESGWSTAASCSPGFWLQRHFSTLSAEDQAIPMNAEELVSWSCFPGCAAVWQSGVCKASWERSSIYRPY